MTSIPPSAKASIPRELMIGRRFVAWGAVVSDDGKPGKEPISPRSGQRASSNEPKDWTTAKSALQFARDQNLKGIWRASRGDNGLAAVDLDHCRDPQTGIIQAWAWEIIKHLDSYTEISPSGGGVHVWVSGCTLPFMKRKSGHKELFHGVGFVSITNEHLDGTPSTINERGAALAAWFQETFPTSHGQNPVGSQVGSFTSHGANGAVAVGSEVNEADDDDLLLRIKGSRQGEGFSQLWRGNWQARYDSQSEADMALCSTLYFWARGNVDTVDRLFRRSGLMREKWDEPRGESTYGWETIARLAKKDAANSTITSLPTGVPYRALPMGSEVSGAELALAGASAPAELPSLPLLGCKGYIIRGWSHLIAGYPRVGKTELLIRQVLAWLNTGERVLYISEEPRSVWEWRLARIKGNWANLRMVFGLGIAPAALLARAKSGDEGVVIIDALRNILCPTDEKDNSALAMLVNPWVLGAREANKTLIVLHHARKGIGEHGEGIAGGHALMGCFDAPVEIRFDSGNKDERRVIESHARLVRPEKLVYELREDGAMVALGTPKDLTLLEVVGRCVAALDQELLTTNQVMERLDVPKPGMETLRKALLYGVAVGQVVRDPPLSAGSVQGRIVRWGADLTSLPTGVLYRVPPVGSKLIVKSDEDVELGLDRPPPK